MAQSVEDIVNQALRAVGVRKRIAWIYEGSPEARAALEVYSQNLDEVLAAQDWPFARAGGATPLVLLKGPPPAGGYSPLNAWSTIYPAAGFLYEYAYPVDCVEIRALIRAPMFIPDLDPKPMAWRIDNDAVPIVSGNPPVASGPPQKVILTNVGSALAVYRRRVTNPALWTDPLFVLMVVDGLAAKLSMSLTGKPGTEQLQMAGQAGALADMTKG